MSHWNCWVITPPNWTNEQVDELLKGYINEPYDDEEWERLSVEIYEPCNMCGAWRKTALARERANRIVGDYHIIRNNEELRQVWTETEQDFLDYCNMPDIDPDCEYCDGTGISTYRTVLNSKADYFQPITDEQGRYSILLSEGVPTVEHFVDFNLKTRKEINWQAPAAPYAFLLPNREWVDRDNDEFGYNLQKWLIHCGKIYDKYKHFRAWFFHCHS